MNKISICLPAIRKHLWQKLYDSIVQSIGNYQFELVLVGPYEPDQVLLDTGNVKHILDWGCPTRCHQLACINATGNIITWCPDDGWYLPNKLKEWVDHFLAMGDNYKNVLITKYIEGGHLSPNESYCLNYHDDAKSHLYPDHFLIFNSAMLYKRFFIELGGFDCEFDGCAMSNLDFGVRAQRCGANCVLWPEVTMEYTQDIGHAGDHQPIHDSQLGKDQPHYKSIWRNEHVCLNRGIIELDNWQNVPEIWSYRFGKQ